MATEVSAERAALAPPRASATNHPPSWYVGQVVRYSILIAMTVILLGPFVLALLGSFKSNAEVLAYPPTFLPSQWRIQNYVDVWNNVTDRSTGAPLMPRWIFNSLFLAVIHVVVYLFFCSLAAFAFARLRFPGRDLILGATLATLMVPAMVILIPKYQIIASLHWVNTYWALIVPGIAGAFGVFFLTQFFRGIPKDLEEAAQIDGAGLFTIYYRVILPMAQPALITLAILEFQGSWNGFTDALIMLNTPEMFTLPVGLSFLKGTYISFYNLVLAGSMFNTLPVLIIFALFSRYYVSTGVGSAVKG